MSDDESDAASPEQLLNIAGYFVMSSPSGEVHDVLVGNSAHHGKFVGSGGKKGMLKSG
jgi:hypothetical protein